MEDEAGAGQTGPGLAAALDLLGRRWALRVVWELHDGPLGFRALQAAAGAVSPSVLSSRLRELRGAGLVELTDSGAYTLSGLGAELRTSLGPLAPWAERWVDS